jgi:arylsulfatase A-like enzyme
LVAVRAGRVVLDAADARHLVDLYDAGIRKMDEEIGRLLAAVGDGDDTLLIVTSDHGEEFLEHGSVLHGRTQFGEIMQVPLIIRGAGAPAGVRVGTTVSLIDVMPTILTAAEIAVPPGLDGADLAPTWRDGGSELGARYFFGEADHNNAAPDVTRAIRHDKDKLHLDRLTGLHTLFDLERDPGELVDVARLHPEITARLLARLTDFQEAPTEAGSAVVLDSEQTERLRSLGYVR